MFLSSTLWSWTRSQSHVAKHDDHVPITPLIGSATGCHVDAMAAVWQHHVDKNIKITYKLRPSVHNRFAHLFTKAQRYQVGTILLEMMPRFFLKSSGPQNCTFTRVAPLARGHRLPRCFEVTLEYMGYARIFSYIITEMYWKMKTIFVHDWQNNCLCVVHLTRGIAMNLRGPALW